MKDKHHICKAIDCRWNTDQKCHCDKIITIDVDKKCKYFKKENEG